MTGNKKTREILLVVDDNPDTLEVLQRNLSSEGYLVYTASMVQDAIGLLNSTAVDLVITDYKMPDNDGLDLIKHVRANYKNTEIMMITGFATVQNAVAALKAGAEEYLSKPFTERELFCAVRRVLDKLKLSRNSAMPAESLPENHGIIGESEPMLKVFSAVRKASATQATVIIYGESGTGKELIARAIHYNSSRASDAFVPVNCGAIPENLLESELFGHVKGSFTGATATRAGFFQTADGGTIFLDEIADTSLAMQTKLLRVLEAREVSMVGSSLPRSVNVRVLAASNKPLLQLVKKGIFREDLYYRLNVINVIVPPLRERNEDILLLARHFASKFSKELKRPVPRFAKGVSQAFLNYDWPGNVRELENIIQRILIMADGPVIDLPDLPHHMRYSAPRNEGVNRTLEEVESEHIRNVLASVRGNKSKASEILGIDRKTLRIKLNRLSEVVN